jgi:hypothetical protein
MSGIDWSKAPEGATHATMAADECQGNYYRISDKGADLWCQMAGWIGSMNELNWLIQNAVKRPQAWTGAGLPPVGTILECRFSVDPDTWHQGTVTHKGMQPEGFEFCMVDTGEYQACYSCAGGWLRPIRTPEQIAAEERAQAIEKMWSIYWQPHATSAKQALGLLWDAGLRFADDPDNA